MRILLLSDVQAGTMMETPCLKFCSLGRKVRIDVKTLSTRGK